MITQLYPTSVAQKVTLAIFLSVLLVACGGGSGGSSSGSTGDPPPATDIGGGGTSDPEQPPPEEQPPEEQPPENQRPEVDVCVDISVDEGSVVELRVTAQDPDGTVEALAWSQTAGTPVLLEDSTSQVVTFVAPILTEEQVLTIQVKVTDNNGATAADSVQVTVVPVNLPPEVNAGTDQTLRGLTEVSLQATASDPDGSVVSYQWRQIDGEAVDLPQVSGASLTFETPSTVVDLELAFEVEVTDNEGGTAQDTVRVIVTPENAPDVSILFPPAMGLYEGELIDVFGAASPRGTAQIEKVMVNAGSKAVEAELSTNGVWRAPGFSLPSGMTELTIRVTVTDTEGLEQTDEAVLLLGQDTLGEGPEWEESPGLALAPSGKVVYLLTSGFRLSDTKLLAVDLATGHRLDSITNFTDESFGPVYGAFTDMVFDSVGERFLLASAPSEADHLIVAVDLATGERSVLSGADVGSGPAFELPNDLMLDDEGQLWVTNNDGSEGAASIMTVDMITGERVVVIDESTMPTAVDAPLSGVFASDEGLFYVVENIDSDSPILAFDVTSDVATGTTLSAADPNASVKISAGAESLHLDEAHNRLILRSRGDDHIVAVDLATGERTLLAPEVLGTAPTLFDRSESAYHAHHNLLYVAGGGSRDALVVVDLESGDKVTVSR